MTAAFEAVASARTALLSTIAVNAAPAAATDPSAQPHKTGARSALAAFPLVEAERAVPPSKGTARSGRRDDRI
jgi:hypothetical protein